MVDKTSIPRSIADEAVRAVTSYVVLTYVIPLGITALSGYLLRLQGLPWGYVAVGTALAFGGIFTGLVRLDEWRDRRSVAGKLHFAGVRVIIGLHDSGIRIGVHLRSSAASSIDCELVRWQTQIGDRVPKEKPNRSIVHIPPGGEGWFDDGVIETGPLPRPGALRGSLEFHLRYGRANGSRRNDMVIKKQLAQAFDAGGNPLPSSWYDAA